jgi:hypothetical protein
MLVADATPNTGVVSVIPAKVKAPVARFRATAVVPMYTVELPRTEDGIVPDRLPAVRLVRFAPDTAPNEPDHVPDVIVPTLVRLEPTTPEPSAVALRTVVPAISYTLPVKRFRSSDDVHAEVALTQLKVLSVAPFRVIPPPSAVVFVGVPTEPSSIFLSSTLIVVELIVVVVPLTTRSPPTVTLPDVVRLVRVPTDVREDEVEFVVKNVPDEPDTEIPLIDVIPVGVTLRPIVIPVVPPSQVVPELNARFPPEVKPRA